jgi:hypothetical protein
MSTMRSPMIGTCFEAFTSSNAFDQGRMTRSGGRTVMMWNRYNKKWNMVCCVEDMQDQDMKLGEDWRLGDESRQHDFF